MINGSKKKMELENSLSWVKMKAKCM
jgi:hypothetical protein